MCCYDKNSKSLCRSLLCFAISITCVFAWNGIGCSPAKKLYWPPELLAYWPKEPGAASLEERVCPEEDYAASFSWFKVYSLLLEDETWLSAVGLPS